MRRFYERDEYDRYPNGTNLQKNVTVLIFCDTQQNKYQILIIDNMFSQPIDPEKEAVVTIGSLKEVIFTGGPQPWVLDTSKYFQDSMYFTS